MVCHVVFCGHVVYVFYCTQIIVCHIIVVLRALGSVNLDRGQCTDSLLMWESTCYSYGSIPLVRETVIGRQ